LSKNDNNVLEIYNLNILYNISQKFTPPVH
jgi:hypothetical protein